MKKITFIICLASSSCFAQTKDYSADVQNPNAIINALYEVISGEAQEPRDWQRFKNLFTEDARLIPTFKNKEGKIMYRAITPSEYEISFTKKVTSFFERELSRKTESYGNIMHIFSTYETKLKKDGPVTDRGINSIQLFFNGERYFIVNIFWSAESQGFPLPEKYLTN